MIFKCEKQDLCEAVSVVSRAVSSKSALPILEGMLIKTAGQSIELFGYDLDTGIKTELNASVEKQGSIVLPAKMLLDIAKNLPDGTVTISSDERYLTQINCCSASFTILGMKPEEFPEFPLINDAAELSVPQNLMRSMIEQTIFAVSQSDAKPVHMGSLFELEKDKLTIVSVDGYRLALRREKIKNDSVMRFVVHGRALNELSKILKSDSDDEISITVSKRHIMFKVDEYCIFTRLLEGDFLDYNTAIPKDASLRVKVSARPFINSVERVSLLISDKIKSPLRVKIEGNEISLNCSTTLGKASDVVTAQCDGKGLEIGFNSRYLLDALRAAESDEVVFEISGQLSPMKVLPASGDSFVFLVLPVRLKSEGI